MNALLIIGAGGHGKVVADAAAEQGVWGRIAFLDDRYPELAHANEWPVIGVVAQMASIFGTFTHLAVAIGDNQKRIELLQESIRLGYKAPVIIHPTAFVSLRAHIGQGTVIFAKAAVNVGTTVGMGCIINTGATVDHDCVIAQGVHVSPGAHLAGEVTVGEFSWIGIGASVRQCVAIGRNVIVGAGAAVVANVLDERTVTGVPAKEQPINVTNKGT